MAGLRACLWAALAAAGVLAAAPARGQSGDAPDSGVEAGGGKPPVFFKSLEVARRPIIQRDNPFHIELTNLRDSAAGISEILLEVYDPDEGQWKGYGLMNLRS